MEPNLKEVSKSIDKGLLAVRDAHLHAKNFYFDPNVVSLSDLNHLVKFIFDKFKTVAFDTMLVVKSTSFTRDETIMLYLEQVPIDYSEMVKKIADPLKKNTDGAVFKLVEKGPKIVNSNDIKETERSHGLKIGQNYPLFWLREEEEVDLTLYARWGDGSDHPKFRPVTTCYVIPAQLRSTTFGNDDTAPDGHQLNIESVGVIDPNDIFVEALTLMKK